MTTDILFINPLGWDRYIWTRVLENMPDQTFDFIEFTEESFKSISKKEIDQVLLDKMTKVKRGGYIVCASYGTVVLLNGLEMFSEYLDGINLIIIEGLEPIPPRSILRSYFESEIKFTSKEEYLSKTLSVDELKDKFLTELLLRKLRKQGSEYVISPSPDIELQYLSLYAGVDNLELLKKCREIFNNVTIFSYFKLTKTNYTQIEEDDHLLMVTKPQMILNELGK
ncbi:hypothetical protein [Gemella cuniculi]|uniref:hypothetical protein n=1 Tax=Gemella cuniculi TaxID=150240 RepID=UPI0003F8EBEA|nr:hypothetical protein [Gemella cuniculi]